MQSTLLVAKSKFALILLINGALFIAASLIYKKINTRRSMLVCSDFDWMKIKIDQWKAESQIIPPTKRVLRLRTTDNTSLAQCIIPKSMTTIVHVMFGLIGHPENCQKLSDKTVAGKKWFIDRVSKKFTKCISGTKLLQIKKDGFQEIKNLTIFAIAREPINRFFSGWLDKCIGRIGTSWAEFCYNCEYNLECFIQRNYQNLKQLSTKIGKQLFSDYHMYHYIPWSWMCKPNDNLGIRFIKYQRNKQFYSEIESLLSTQNLDPHNFKNIKEMLEESSTMHATHGSEQMEKAVEFLKTREDLYELLIKTYYHDYFASPFFTIYPTFNCWLDANEELQNM